MVNDILGRAVLGGSPILNLDRIPAITRSNDVSAKYVPIKMKILSQMKSDQSKHDINLDKLVVRTQRPIASDQVVVVLMVWLMMSMIVGPEMIPPKSVQERIHQGLGTVRGRALLP